MQIVRKAWAYYHEFGIRELLRRIQHRQEFAIFIKELVLEQVEHAYPDVAFRVASSADEPLLSTQTLRWEESQGISNVASRLAAGDLAILGVSPENPSDVMYVSWLSRDDRLFRMCADSNRSSTQACSRRIWVPDRYRRRGLAERGLSFAESVAFQAGLRHLWAFTLRERGFNPTALQARIRIGRFPENRSESGQTSSSKAAAKQQELAGPGRYLEFGMFQAEEEINEACWDKQVCSLGGSLQHAAVYARYVSTANANAVPCYMSLQDDNGGLLGAAIGFHARSLRKLLGPLTGRVWLEALPTIRSDAENGLLEFLRNVELYARSSGNTILEVHSTASRGGRDDLARLNFKLAKRLEFVLDLKNSEDELWQRMKPQRRQRVRKASRIGVTVRDLPGEEGILELRRLQGESSERIMARGGPDISRRHLVCDDPLKVLIDAGVGRIVIAELDGRIVSAGLFTLFNGLVYQTLSGHSNDGMKAQAPTLLLWETIKRYRQEGAKRFNFGGCSAKAVEKGSPEHGVYDYKNAFGGECIECTSGRKVLRRVRYGLLRAIKGIAEFGDDQPGGGVFDFSESDRQERDSRLTIPVEEKGGSPCPASADRIRGRFLKELVPLAHAGLERMRLLDGCGFCHRASQGADGKLTLIGRSQRYSAMCLIGLAMQARLDRKARFPTDKVCDCLVDWVERDARQGDAGLVLWALTLRKDPRAERIVRSIVDREEQLASKQLPRNSASLGWLLTGLSAAISEGIGGDSLNTTAESVFRLLLRNRNATTGLFSLAGAGPRKDTFKRRLNKRLGSFASQVYPTIGLSYYALATEKEEPAHLAEQTADAVCGLQGPVGQWWWIYDTSAGEPVIRYPVYCIHQDAMGPMVLLSVSLATEGRKNYADSIWKGLEWLNHHPESCAERLVQPDAGVIWRAIQRDKPTRTGTFGLGLAERLRLNLSAWTGLSDRRSFEAGYVCKECRPYHLGWILVAAAMCESWHKKVR